ncbi:MAG TPA: 4-hydroxy-2-oxoheptanedioate aldolase [Caldimonas sp.]|jgi:4-hydroxy-2-oxoheptanedioate aldolase|nr:4-hydroxy-2-oxoheptanedioate aldolase [Caldimonas sp.]HEV7578680.1 4-hydroxy-2-oxoheptanedioate aldolase [Caldimonas sp.]
MKLPVNSFKAALKRREAQIGLWVGLADPYVAELLATTGFDWLLIDGEHAPNDVRSALAQLQALAAYPVSPVVRPVDGDTALIKQYLDVGALTLLVPMVETAAQAAQIVAATRYAPRGVRGLGSALARASRWSGVDGYVEHADEEICVLVQVESTTGLANVDAIAAVEGVDGVFFGPADLSASMGHLGRPQHPEVRKALDDGIAAVVAAGKAPGILATDPALARGYLAVGALFVAVGLDTAVLGRAARTLAAEFGRAAVREDAGGFVI